MKIFGVTTTLKILSSIRTQRAQGHQPPLCKPAADNQSWLKAGGRLGGHEGRQHADVAEDIAQSSNISSSLNNVTLTSVFRSSQGQLTLKQDILYQGMGGLSVLCAP